jgi:hypothetical protein
LAKQTRVVWEEGRLSEQ